MTPDPFNGPCDLAEMTPDPFNATPLMRPL